MTKHFSDRLADALRQKGTPLCVGLDPRWEQLPQELTARHGIQSLESVAAAFEELCLRVLEIVSPLVAVVKPQMAFFEMCGPPGLAVLQRVLHRARSLGLVTILDGKRNDIASTAEAYADAAFDGVKTGGKDFPVWDADAITINPYLGRDAVEPFLKSARRAGRGVFVLVRTSNPGAGQFQDLTCDGKPLFHHVAQAVGQWTCESLGTCGLGDVGAVVGATHPSELVAVRKMLPQSWLLVPGFGAQGGAAADVAPALLPNGLGAIVNSSRGITACFSPSEKRWEAAVEAATRAAISVLPKVSHVAN